MTFINLKTGEFYDGGLHNDGENPFVNWFDGPQSVNIIYPQRFVYLSDSDTPMQLVLPEDSVFFFYNENPEDMVNIDNVEYYNLEKCYSTLSEPVKDGDNTITVGEQGEEKYLYTFVVYASSQDIGSITDEIEFLINNSSIGKITVGADFYAEEETLTSNLENFGIEIPSIIQKAFFNTNVHEDLNDNITLNRKRKELLLNYWDIIANKGSYNSLLNALKWFEYGDLVELKEYWKHQWGDRIFYDPQDIDELTGNIITEKIQQMARTTYIGIYLALNKIFTDENAGYDKETNPLTYELDDAVLKWTKEDLAFKMTLLGNFYSTYMMPIHLDLLHSSLERIVFTFAFDIIGGSAMRRKDRIYNTFPASVRISDKDGLNPNRDKYYLEYTDAYVYKNTLFGKTNTSSGHTAGDLVLIGYEPLRANDTDDNSDSSVTASKWFNGMGKLVRFDVSILKEYVKDGDIIYDSRLFINDKLTISNSTIKLVLENPDDKYYKFTFWLLFENAGEYHISCVFNTLSRMSYSFNKVVNISDTTSNYIHTYLVNREDISEIETSNVVPYFNDNINKFCFKSTPLDDTNYYYEQQIIYDETDRKYLPGVNHVLEFILDDDYTLSWNNETETYLIDISDFDIDDLREKIHWYWWDVADRYTTISGNTLGNEVKVLRGICKYFTIDEHYAIPFTMEGGNLVYSNSQYGLPKYKVSINTENRVLDEDCFLPGLHTLEELKEPCIVKKNQLVAVKPLICRSLRLNIENNPDKYNWIQENLTTGTIYNIGLPDNSPCEPFLIQTDEPGYYRVKRNYKLDNDDLEEICSSSYLIEK